MVSWRLVFTKQAQKDAKKIAHSGLKLQAERILEILKENPFNTKAVQVLRQYSFAYIISQKATWERCLQQNVCKKRPGTSIEVS